MAKNIKYEPGWRKDYVCTKPDKPVSGDPVRIGNMTGIALAEAALMLEFLPAEAE